MGKLLIKLFIKDSDKTDDPKVRESYGVFCGIVGIICNLFLCAFKLTVGLLVSSISIIADGLNNLSDMGSSVVSMVGFRLAGKPADRDHPFGHGRIEYVSAFIVAGLIILVGFELLTSSVSAIVKASPAPHYSSTSLIILAVSVLLKLWMWAFVRMAGKRINSSSLLATAQDSINDTVASTAILAAVGIQMIWDLPFNLDAVMGIAVALFIIYSGFMAGKQTLDEILGQSAPPELIRDIEKIIMSFDGFLGIHDLMVHNYGPGRQFASVHVEVPYGSDIVHCHEQVDLCEKVVAERLGVELVIHMDPIDIENEVTMNTRNQIDGVVKAIDSRLSIHDFRMTPKGDTRTNLIFDVVVPSDVPFSQEELGKQIAESTKQLDSTFCCVITFDNDYTGH